MIFLHFFKLILLIFFWFWWNWHHYTRLQNYFWKSFLYWFWLTALNCRIISLKCVNFLWAKFRTVHCRSRTIHGIRPLFSFSWLSDRPLSFYTHTHFPRNFTIFINVSLPKDSRGPFGINFRGIACFSSFFSLRSASIFRDFVFFTLWANHAVHSN